MDASPTILAIRSLLPEHRFEAADVEAAFLNWLAHRPEADRLKAKRILRNSGVATRRSCLSMSEVFSRTDLTESSRRYREHAVRLGTRLLKETLDEAGVAPRDVDILVTTSCTGFMIPSADAYMANSLGMRPDILRLPVTQMGCAAGASALMYASEMLRRRPGAIAAIVNIELPTNTMQLDDYSMENIVSSALFSDGLACLVVGNDRRPTSSGRSVTVDAWAPHQVPDSLSLIGYHLTTTGFLMSLDPALPDVIAAHFERAASALLGPVGLSLGDLAHVILHPGGVKILDRIEPILARHGLDARLSRETLRDCGNMSSSTVIVILERLLASQPRPGKALLMSFGPGFGAHQLLLTIGSDN